MECKSVGKRMGSEKALKDEKFRDKRGKFNGGDNWVSSSDDDNDNDDDDDGEDGEDEDDEEECLCINESEFRNSIRMRESKINSCKELGFEKNDNLGKFCDDNLGENSSSLDYKGKRIILDLDDDGDDDHDAGDAGVLKSGNVNDGVHINDDVNDGSDDDDDDDDGVHNNDRGVNADVNDADSDDHDGDGDGGGGEEGDEPNVGEFRRRLFEGMVLLTNPNKSNANANANKENNFIGRRTRSHYKPSSSLSRKKLKGGTFRVPINIDIDDESSSSSDEEAEAEDEDEGGLEPESPERNREGEGNERKRKRGRPPKKKESKFELMMSRKKAKGVNKRLMMSRKKAKGVNKRLQINEVQDLLVNAMLENDANGNEVMLDSLVSSSVSQAYLPLKFSFGVQNKQPEISEEDQELEYLFKEMDSALGVCDIGSQTSCVMDNKEDEIVVPHDSAILHQKLCLEGKHYWIHDDEIGIRCKFCSVVKLEIRHVMPEFNVNPFGRSEGGDRYYGLFPYDGTNNVSEKYQFPDFSYDSRDYLTGSDTTEGTVWDLIPGTKRTLYPHQRDGFEFLWKNIAGGIRVNELGDLTKSGRGGCIICHAPGTGKTRLAIVFLQSFMKKYPKAKPVILAPYSMLRTWEEEFARWNVDVPFFNLNEKEFSEKEYHQLLKVGTEKNKNVRDENAVRMMKLTAWIKVKGVLVVSYGLFQRLASEKEGTSEKVMEKSIDKHIRQVLLRQPDVVVLDEGHTPRNEKSSRWKVLSNVSTKRRVILSGTPFQNNLEELHSTISLVREEFVPCFYHLTENDRRIEVLRKQIEPFVHVHKGEILRETLPGLFDSLVILKPSDLQKKFFALLATIRNIIKFDNLISVTSVHPSIFWDTNQDFSVGEENRALLEKHKTDVNAGVKTQFLVELIKLCKGERILVFGQYLPPLKFIGELLQSLFQWTEGRELLYMYGDHDMKKRQSLIKNFNDPKSEARVLLASTKACCEGINLVGASRVVLLDVVWNPSVKRQAIFRAYRLGQQRDVFVYHLITAGTLEEEKYRRQATKESIGEQLFSTSSPSLEVRNTHKKSIESRAVLKDHILEEMNHHDETKNMFEKIDCQPKVDYLIRSFGSHN